jgi:predicted metal-dependent RNase
MPHRQEAEAQLLEVISKTMERGGTVLIPTFAVERAQDVMAILVQNDFQYPVFIDGMIWDATGIFTAYPEYMSHNIQRSILNNQDPFISPIFKRIASPAEREKSWTDKPAVILSTSGMLVGGPAMEHLKALAEDERNTLAFVGYQCVKGDTKVNLSDNSMEIKKIFDSGEEFIKTNKIELRKINESLLGLNLSQKRIWNGFSNICSRRFYKGEIIRIETENGNEIFLSPNHPVLTKNYIWKLAKNLNQNDEVWVSK